MKKQRGRCGEGGLKEALATRIAGEITISRDPGATMRRWRRTLSVTQRELSERMGLSPSVISDYESGRRGNPGVNFVRRFVEALMDVGGEEAERLIAEWAGLPAYLGDVVLDVKAFPKPVSLRRLVRTLSGEVLTGDPSIRVWGYIIVECEGAIRRLTLPDLPRIFGEAGRVVVFAGVTPKLSPVIALNFAPLKPRVVVYQGSKPSSLEVEIARNSGVTLVHSGVNEAEELVGKLRRIHKRMAG